MKEVKRKKSKNTLTKKSAIKSKNKSKNSLPAKKNSIKLNKNPSTTPIATKVVKEEKKNEEEKTNPEIVGPDLKELEQEITKDIHKSFHSSKKIYFLIIFLILLIFIFIGLHFVTPSIDLIGPSTVEISYRDTYQEQGASAHYLKKDLTDYVKIKSNIENGKVGTYKVTYEVEYKIYKIKKIRTVKVVDNDSPVITLEGEQEVNICPNGKFKEIGYKAFDDYDQDITDHVEVTETENEVIYSVKDSSGNQASIKRKINKIDTTSPKITLKGNTTMYLNLEESFKEPGYTVEDNCSSNLDNKVVVKGEVKEKVKGTYTLTYEVEDDYGNKGSISRKIIISEKTDPNSGTYKSGVIYLTFDDGPSNVTTGEILDVLKEEGVKATFFVTNNGPDYLIKRMYDEGHTVALHTATHNYATVYNSVDSYFNDLSIVSNRVKRITGQVSKIIRFPGGSSNTVSRRYQVGIMSTLVNDVLNQGYRYYDWNIDSQDAVGANRNQVYQNVTSALSKNKMNMVLMHDIKTATRDAIRDIIHYGKDHGYTFERIDMDTYMIRQRVNN